jgi:hypothetical protein|tara:strand:- start:48 stop:473 length:426 start_codon:yes stop_codon:yes gene_type:complete
MFNSVLHNYPSVIAEEQQKSYIYVLLQIAALDGISDAELYLVKEMGKASSISDELLNDCLLNYSSYDVSKLPDYHINWAMCLMRDAVAVANVDNGISKEEFEYICKLGEYADIDTATMDKITNSTKEQMKISDTWASLMSN